MSLSNTFRALITRAKKTPAKVETLTRADLPTKSAMKKTPGECDLLVAVDYSSVNYKDAMVVTGNYPGMPLPMVGGVDLAGTVAECRSDRFAEGDRVVVNGYGVGSDHFGGYAEMASINSHWAIGLPQGLEPADAARIGIAGYTAMLCVDALENNGVKPWDGPVLVTGATGGVGSTSIILLSELGYEVVALTGKVASEEAWLKKLGAKDVMARSEMEGEPKALAKETYAGCVDTVGDKVLANALTQTKFYGTVAACGLAGGMSLNTTVAPFILRGVTLAGIDSVYNLADTRRRIYEKFVPVLTSVGGRAKFDMLVGEAGEHTVGLEEVPGVADRMLKGKVKGRYVVDVKKK